MPGDEQRPSRWRTVVTAVLIVVLVSPVVTSALFGAPDGFPLSTYPMYATPRGAEADFVVARGITASGEPVKLTTLVVAGTRDPLVAESYLRDAVDAGRADITCAAIAERADQVSIALASVELRAQRHDLGRRGSPADTVIDDRLVTSCVTP